MFEGNSTVIVLLLCLFLMVEMGKGIEKEAFIDIATLKDLEIPWMWVASTAEEKAPQFVKVIDVIKKDVGKEKKDEVSIGPTSISQPRFIGNLKNKLCKVGLGIGCNLNFGMDKAAARPIIPQDINYVQPLVIQAVGRPIPAIPASDPNYGKADKKYKKNPQAPSQPSFKPQTSQHIPGYNPVGQYSSPPLVASPPGEHLSQPGQEFSSGVPVPAPPNFKLPMHSFQVESPQHTLISMDPMTTFIAHPFNSDGNGLLSNGGNLISGGHVISAGNLINGGHTLNGGQLISNNQAVDGTILKSGQIIANGQTLDGNFVNGGHFISNGMLMNDNNFANSHIIRGGHIFSGNINGGSSVSNNANHINKNNINMKDFFSNKLAKSDLKNMINIPGNGFILQQPSSSNINKLDSNSFSVPVDFSFDQGFGTPQNFDTPQLQNGPQIFKAEFNAVGFPSSERPKKEAHFPFPHDQHQQHHQDQHQQHNPAPPTSSISHQNNPTQVVQHIHVHKHVHQMDDGSPDTLAKRIQGNLDIISTPGFGSGLRGSNVIREFLEQNEKPPFKRKVESTPKLPSKQSAANDDRCSCVRKDRCPVENVVETAAKEDISFMQDPRNKRSESKVLSTSASISTESNVSKSSDATTIPNEKKNLSTKPLNMLKFRKNLDALPKLLLNSKSQNLEGNSANKITGLNPLAERKILLNIKRHTKRDVSHLFNIDNNFSIKNISSSLGGDFPFKRSNSACLEDQNLVRIKRSPQFVKVNPDSENPQVDNQEVDQEAEAAVDKENPETKTDKHDQGAQPRFLKKMGNFVNKMPFELSFNLLNISNAEHLLHPPPPPYVNLHPFRPPILPNSTPNTVVSEETLQFDETEHQNPIPLAPPLDTSAGTILLDYPIAHPPYHFDSPLKEPLANSLVSWPHIPPHLLKNIHLATPFPAETFLMHPLLLPSQAHSLISTLGPKPEYSIIHSYPNIIASYFTKTVSRRRGMPILNDLHDRHFMTTPRHHLNEGVLSTNACRYVSCRDLSFYCNSPNSRRHSRPNRAKKRQQSRSDLPFSCGLHEVCCNTDYVDFSLVGAPLTPSTGRSCGASTANVANGRIKTNIISEGEAKFGEFPWQAAILKKEGTDNVYICAGTVIDESHVLTAAHCVEGYKATQLRVRLGEWDVNRDTEFYPHIEYDAIGVAIHPDFFSGNLINDIALIRMLYPIDLDKNPHISPICLPATGSDYDGRRCWVSGWGKNGFGKNGKYQNLLKKVDVPVVSRQICQDILRETRLGPNYLLHKGMLCAGGEPEKDACKGDGGGPLSCPDIHGNFVLVGIVSWGIGCGQQGVPGVYTNVEYYRSWISKMIEAK